jgi:hypothetical protein
VIEESVIEIGMTNFYIIFMLMKIDTTKNYSLFLIAFLKNPVMSFVDTLKAERKNILKNYLKSMEI